MGPMNTKTTEFFLTCRRYSSASVTDNEDEIYKLDPELTEIMETSRDYDRLKWAWQSWRDVSGKQMKDLYEESVQLQNDAVKGAGE